MCVIPFALDMDYFHRNRGGFANLSLWYGVRETSRAVNYPGGVWRFQHGFSSYVKNPTVTDVLRGRPFEGQQHSRSHY